MPPPLDRIGPRFGALDPALERRIAGASPEALDHWIERVVIAERIDDIFAA